MSDRRTAILEAAITVIARNGVRGLRVEEVAAEAGVAVSLIYYHFTNRSGLVRATLEHANEHDAAAIRSAASGEKAGRELVELTLLAALDEDEQAKRTSRVWGEVVASAAFHAEYREPLREAHAAWVELLSGAIRRGVEDGSIGPGVDPDASALRLTATAEGVAFHWHAGLIDAARGRELLAGAIENELGADLRARSTARA